MDFDTKAFAFVVNWLKALNGLGDNFSLGDMMWSIILWAQETDGVSLKIQTPPSYYGAFEKRYDKLVVLHLDYQTPHKALFGEKDGPALHASLNDETKHPGEALVVLIYKLYKELLEHESYTEEEMAKVFGAKVVWEEVEAETS